MTFKLFVYGDLAITEEAAKELDAPTTVPDGKYYTVHYHTPKYGLRKDFERRILVPDGAGLKRDPFKVDGALVEVLVEKWDFDQDPTEAGLNDLSPQIAEVLLYKLQGIMYPEVLSNESPFGQALSAKLQQSADKTN